MAPPTLWRIKNPMTLEIKVYRHGETDFSADYPSLNCNGKGRTMDEAILNLAKAIQLKLERMKE